WRNFGCERGRSCAAGLNGGKDRGAGGRAQRRRGYSTDAASVTERWASGALVSATQGVKIAFRRARPALPLGSPSSTPQWLSAFTTEGVAMNVSLPAMRRK